MSGRGAALDETRIRAYRTRKDRGEDRMAGVLEKHEVAYDTAPEPTLGALATRFVRTTVPRRLYQLLHLALPVAIDFAVRGWWRMAGWSLALAAFGAWGLADQWLAESAADNPRRAWWVRAARAGAGVLATVPPIVLLLEAFLRLLGDAPGH
jgi:hypothetical protein